MMPNTNYTGRVRFRTSFWHGKQIMQVEVIVANRATAGPNAGRLGPPFKQWRDANVDDVSNLQITATPIQPID